MITMSTLKEFLKSSENMIQFTFDTYNYTMTKVKYNENTDLIYICEIYNRKTDDTKPVGGQHFCDIGSDLKYQGFYNYHNNEIYDVQYTIYSNLLGIKCSERNLLSDISKALVSELVKKVAEIVKSCSGKYRDVVLSERRQKDIEYLKEYEARSTATKLFYNNVTQAEFTIPTYDITPTNDDIIRYIDDRETFVYEYAKDYITNHGEQIAYQLIYAEESQKCLNEIIKNMDGNYYKRREISKAAADKKTVRVKIQKNGTELEFSTETSTLKCADSYHYSTWQIAAKDRGEYKKLFGNEDYSEDDIVSITHGRKVLYENSHKCVI